MSSPRESFVVPQLFGKDLRAAPVPRPVDPDAVAQWHAAVFQHSVAFVVLERLHDRGMTRQQLAAAIGSSYGYLQRVLRGRVSMSLTMLGRLESVLGPLGMVRPAAPEASESERHRVLRAVDRPQQLTRTELRAIRTMVERFEALEQGHAELAAAMIKLKRERLRRW